jgi:hypothetical protein
LSDLLILEINDAGIEAHDASGRLAPPSPGYALVDDVGILVGRNAFENARRRPRSVSHRFWCELDTEPLPRPFPQELSAADLAHAHLEQVWAVLEPPADGVILAVPGTEPERRLGLILGIAQACHIPVVGMVDAAVAAASGADGKRLLHLDLQLHRVVVTELAQGSDLVRGAVHASGEVGLASLQDAWARHIASLFVRKTRFDPLHAADSEQDLYACLPDLLAGLSGQEARSLELEAPDRVHSISVGRGDLVAAADADYERISRLLRQQDAAGATVLLSARAMLPGLTERLRADGVPDVRALASGAAAAGALRHAGAIRSTGEALPFITSLPVRQGVAVASAHPAQPVAAAGAPSHVVHRGLAHALPMGEFPLGSGVPDGRPGLRLEGVASLACTIVRDGAEVQLHPAAEPCRVNGRPVAGPRRLAAGDLLEVAGLHLSLIRTVEGHGSPAA